MPLSSNPLPTKEHAMHICDKANLTDFYYDSCVFDLLSTGDRQFSMSSVTAMRDAQMFDPKLRLRRENSVVLNYLQKDEISSGRTLFASTILLLTACTFHILTR